MLDWIVRKATELSHKPIGDFTLIDIGFLLAAIAAPFVAFYLLLILYAIVSEALSKD